MKHVTAVVPDTCASTWSASVVSTFTYASRRMLPMSVEVSIFSLMTPGSVWMTYSETSWPMRPWPSYTPISTSSVCWRNGQIASPRSWLILAVVPPGTGSRPATVLQPQVEDGGSTVDGCASSALPPYTLSLRPRADGFACWLTERRRSRKPDFLSASDWPPAAGVAAALSEGPTAGAQGSERERASRERPAPGGAALRAGVQGECARPLARAARRRMPPRKFVPAGVRRAP
eukprot:1151949-Prymnesium_polylepis.1